MMRWRSQPHLRTSASRSTRALTPTWWPHLQPPAGVTPNSGSQSFAAVPDKWWGKLGVCATFEAPAAPVGPRTAITSLPNLTLVRANSLKAAPHPRACRAHHPQPGTMPLVVLVGQPCSGKSGVAARLAALLDGQVLVVDEPSVHVQRDAAYASE